MQRLLYGHVAEPGWEARYRAVAILVVTRQCRSCFVWLFLAGIVVACRLCLRSLVRPRHDMGKLFRLIASIGCRRTGRRLKYAYHPVGRWRIGRLFGDVWFGGHSMFKFRARPHVSLRPIMLGRLCGLRQAGGYRLFLNPHLRMVKPRGRRYGLLVDRLQPWKIQRAITPLGVRVLAGQNGTTPGAKSPRVTVSSPTIRTGYFIHNA